jgi:hypothetical protein
MSFSISKVALILSVTASLRTSFSLISRLQRHYCECPQALQPAIIAILTILPTVRSSPSRNGSCPKARRTNISCSNSDSQPIARDPCSVLRRPAGLKPDTRLRCSLRWRHFADSKGSRSRYRLLPFVACQSLRSILAGRAGRSTGGPRQKPCCPFPWR